MMSSNAIEKIKDYLFQVSVEFIKNDNVRENLFSLAIGKEIMDLIESNIEISKYQWIYIPIEDDPPRNLLQDFYIINFLKELNQFVLIHSIKDEFENDKKFSEHFDKQFNLLESKILLSSTFDYKILVPTFQLLLMDDSILEIELDQNHRIKNIRNEDSPYKKEYGINDFKSIPLFWENYWGEPPTVSFEIKFSFLKRSSSDPPYNTFIPPAPINSARNICPIFEKIKSIFDFFFCFNDSIYHSNVFTFGDTYYIILPPFSQNSFENFYHQYTNNEFPKPYRLFILKDQNEIKYWIDQWKDKYNEFYKNYFIDMIGLEAFRMFKRALDVLRIVNKIEYVELRNFLLISTFEGILYLKKIAVDKLNYNKSNKKGPVSEIFVKLSEEKKEYWQYIFVRKYPMNNVLTSFDTKDDLKEFILCAFNYRNNIAHPENIKSIEIKPSYLIPTKPLVSNEEILEDLINRNFPYFLLFLIRTWIQKGFNSISEWYNYLYSLF